MIRLPGHVLQETGVFSMGRAAFWPADSSYCEKTRVEITVNWKEMCKRIPLQFCSFNHKIINHREEFRKKRDTLSDPHLAEDPKHASLYQNIWVYARKLVTFDLKPLSFLRFQTFFFKVSLNITLIQRADVYTQGILDWSSINLTCSEQFRWEIFNWKSQ